MLYQSLSKYALKSEISGSSSLPDNIAFSNTDNEFSSAQTIANSSPSFALKDSNAATSSDISAYIWFKDQNNTGQSYIGMASNDLTLWSRTGKINILKNTNITGDLNVTKNIFSKSLTISEDTNFLPSITFQGYSSTPVSSATAGIKMEVYNDNVSKLILWTETAPLTQKDQIVLELGKVYIYNNLKVSQQLESSSLKLSSLNTAPLTANSNGEVGEIRVTSDAIYVCIQDNKWKKSTLSTF